MKYFRVIHNFQKSSVINNGNIGKSCSSNISKMQEDIVNSIYCTLSDVKLKTRQKNTDSGFKEFLFELILQTKYRKPIQIL